MTARAGRIALTLAAVAASAAALVAPAPAAEAATCGGKRPTIVSRSASITGSLTPDVIVVLGRNATVDAGSGDDVICVRSRGGLVRLSGGAGDDRVLVEGRTTTIALMSGGRDSYRGGPGTDVVSSGELSNRNLDRISLGGGDDRVLLSASTDHRRAVVSGGPGTDEVTVAVARGGVAVDAAARRATQRGRLLARWRAVESYALQAPGSQTFIGSGAGEKVTFLGTGPVVSRSMGGDDEAWVSFAAQTQSAVPRVDGGPGEDLLGVLATASLTVASLVTDRVDVRNDLGQTAGFGFAGFEGMAVDADARAVGFGSTRVEVTGDEGANEIRGSACEVVLRGGDGDDRLRVGSDPVPGHVAGGVRGPSCARTATVHGDAGNDELVSRATDYVGDTPGQAPVDDLLDGGEGTDSADAGLGTDTCVAEVRVGCEH
jgi:hypothetical protein